MFGGHQKIHDAPHIESVQPHRPGTLLASLQTLRRGSGRVGPIASFPEDPTVLPQKTEHGRSNSFTKTLQANARGLVNRLPTMKALLNVGDLAKKTGSGQGLRRSGSSRRIRRREFNFVIPEPTPEKLQKLRWVIMPRSNWKVRWDLWIGFIICYSVVMVPYRIGFVVELQKWELYLNFVFDASFATDIAFNFFTGYFDEDVFVYELPKIRLRYLKSWFIFDLLSTLPMDQFFQAVTYPSDPSLLSFKLLRTIRLVRLLKLIRLLRLKRAVEAIQMDALNAHVFQTLKSLGFIILVIHLISCAWYMFYTWDPTGINWVTNINPDGIASPYLVCFYWVANTMMSVGYGDIYGITDNERLFSIFVECLGSVSVGLIIANIQMLTENYNPRGIKLKQKLSETKEFLLKRGIPRRMRQRVISQFEYHWSHHTVFDEDELLHHFPVSLQYEILAASMESFVKKFPFFGMTSVDFFVFTIPRLRPIVIGPGQPVVEAESVWEEVYFVVGGSLDATRGHAVVSTLTGGDICGIEYLVGSRRRYVHSYVSTSKTELFAIYTADLIEGMELCAIATKYLKDLSRIISERYTDAARRGHKVLQRQEGSNRRASIELFLQYRNRKSQSYHQLTNSAGLDDVKRYQLSVTDDIQLHWSIIRHYSRIRLLWDATMGVVVAWTTISVPFRISFNVADTRLLKTTDRLCDIVFLVDIFLNFFTTYIDETGVEIIDRHEIRKHYLKRSFTIDVVTTIPFDFFVELITASQDFRSLKLIRTIKLVKLLRLVRVMKIFKLNSQRLSELDVSMSTIRLLKLLAPALTIAHYVGCFWYYLSGDLEAKHAWWGRIYLDDPDSTMSKYIASVYWATTTMATVGFGDIFAVNSNEQLFSIFVMIGGTTLFAYVVGTVIEVVSNSKSLMNRENDLGQRVNAYIKERNVSSDFALACQEHLRYMNSEKTLFNEQGLFDALSHSMRSELILYLNSNVLSQIRFFDKKPKWFLTLLLPRLVPQFYLQGDLLIYHGNRVSGIFFLMSGTVVARSPRLPGEDSEPTTIRVTRASVTGSDANGSRSSTPLQRPKPRVQVISIATNGRVTKAVPDNDGTIATLHEGEFFGYKEVLTSSVAQYNVFACLPTGTYTLPSESLEFIRELYPDVLDEMRRFFLHSITKQQTILQHWHNNDIMGISVAERNHIMRGIDHSESLSDEDLPTARHSIPVVADICEVDNESSERAESCGSVLASALSQCSADHEAGSNVRASAQDHFLGEALQVLKVTEIAEMDDGGGEVECSGPLESTVDPSRINRGAGQNLPDGGSFRLRRQSSARQSSQAQQEGELLLPNNESFRLRRQSSDRQNRANSDVLSESRWSTLVRLHSRRNSLVVPKKSTPPLLRFPSMPEEISALVSKLLEVEGYKRPTSDDDNEGENGELN